MGVGKPCGASNIHASYVCRVSLPSAVNDALNKASHQVGILELVNAAKHAGGRGAHKKAVEIGQQMRKENPGGNLKAGEQGREFKRRLREAGLIPAKGVPKSEKAADALDKNITPKGEGVGRSLPTSLKEQLAALAAKDPQLENPKTPSVAKPDPLWGKFETKDLEGQLRFFQNRPTGPKRDLQIPRIEGELARRGVRKNVTDSIGDDLSRIMRGSAPRNLEIASAGDEGGVRARVKGERKSGSASGNTQWAKEEAANFDKNFKSAKHQGGTYDWNETTKPGTKKIGEGSFGTVLMTKGPPPVAVKRGEVSEKEAAIIDKVGKADLGPRLIAGDIEKGGRTSYGVKMSNGRIAMSVVPGKQLMDMSSTRKIGNTTAGDAYWAARASLHRLGVAHNDMHPGNLLIDKTGKGRWVDMGLAHDNPRAALAEALGVMQRPPRSKNVGKGDWQGRNWGNETGLERTTFRSNAPVNLKLMKTNNSTLVQPFLRSKGLNDDEIGEVMTLGIRAKPTQYATGGFAKLSDADALQAINLLYTGVK